MSDENNTTTATLFVVATPIGNLQDMTARAIDTLSKVALIYAEDTRQTYKLLQYFNISTQTFPLHQYNEASQRKEMLNQLNSGKDIAIVSDAGTPLIADPGAVALAYLRREGVKVEVIPGCCSVAAALSISGLSADKFQFCGFIPAKSKQRVNFLTQYRDSDMTTVFFETPHRIIESLADFLTVFGEQRQLFIARELTKKFEESALMTIEQAQHWVQAAPTRVRGEFVLVLAGNPSTIIVEWQPLAKLMLSHGVHTKTIASIVATQSGESKKTIYQYLLAQD